MGSLHWDAWTENGKSLKTYTGRHSKDDTHVSAHMSVWVVGIKRHM
jgi:hypothetical protein